MNCNCTLCSNNNEFYMPNEILKSAKEKQLISFCGAGISTENKNVLPFNFYSEIKEELNIEKDQSFSAFLH